jgi:TolB-like protein
VLPFQNLSRNAEDNFYEFSLADGLITELANRRSMVVRPSQYIALYTGQQVDPRQIGQELAVNTVLTGSFIKSGERFRVTTQLIDISTGKMLWSERIDLDSRDLITIQDTIAERVIAGLRLRLTEEEQKRIDRPLTSSNEAYEFYLRGRDLLFQYMSQTFNDRDLDDAIKMFQEAIRIDPDFARAHYTLGRCYIHHGQGYGGTEYFALAEHSLRRAIELDPTAGTSKISPDRFQRLTTLPRSQRDAPPTHLLRLRTQDYLRGRLESLDDDEVVFSVLDQKKRLPRAAVSRIIWLHPEEIDFAAGGAALPNREPEAGADGGEKPPADPEPAPPDAPVMPETSR